MSRGSETATSGSIPATRGSNTARVVQIPPTLTIRVVQIPPPLVQIPPLLVQNPPQVVQITPLYSLHL
jgi:hypothetical protein